MTREAIERNPVLKLAFEFSLELIRYCDQLEKRRKFKIADQLLRSGTSIGANSIEAQNAESKKDFIHKFKIAAKEGEETSYWLILCKHSDGFPDPGDLLIKVEALNKLICKIIATSKGKNSGRGSGSETG